MTSSTPRVLCAFALAAAACATAAPPGRDPRLVSSTAALDQGLRTARQLSLADARYDQSVVMLDSLRERFPREPLTHLATLLLARVELARSVGAPPARASALAQRAAQLVGQVPEGVDLALDMRRDLVLGLLAARAANVAEAQRRLRAVDGRMIDGGENASAACGLLAVETGEGGDPARALRALARVEVAYERAIRWLPTGLACEDADARREALEVILPQIDRAQLLADTLDSLPAGYAGRVAIALRLREIARANGELTRWLRWLADLGDDEATLGVDADADADEVVSVGLLVPLSGPRTPLGVDIVRAVQIAVARQRRVQLQVEDEGRDPAVTQRSIERMIERGARWIIGPTREELSRPAASFVHDAELMLLAPWEDALTFGAVHIAAPGMRDRITALRAAVGARARRVAVIAPSVGSEEGPPSALLAAQSFQARLRADLIAHGVATQQTPGAEMNVLAGGFLPRAREAILRQIRSAPRRWVIDARVGWRAAEGLWVGVEATDDFARFHERFCQLSGYPPGELAILAHDAARAVLQQTRGLAPHPAARWTFAQGDGVAARRPCGSVILPPTQQQRRR